MQKGMFAAMITAMCLGYTCGKHSGKKKEKQKKSRIEKYLSLYKPWLDKMQKGEGVADFIVRKQYGSVAVYGLGKFGVSLINELKSRGITIAYIIDQRAEEIFYQDIDVYVLSDKLPKVETVIITTVNDQQELKKKVKCYMDCDVYTLEELLLA